MARWLGFVVFGLLALGLLPVAASADGCPNEQFRTGLSASLPDCRAYEQVSPVEKNGGEVSSSVLTQMRESSADGSKVGYVSTQAFADAQTGATTLDPYIASRSANGWLSHSLLPPMAALGQTGPNPLIEAFSPDLSSAVLKLGEGEDSPPLVSGEPQEGINLFVRGNSNDSYRLVDVTPAGATLNSVGALLKGASSDLSHIVFTDYAQLTANAPADGGVYEWADGVVSFIGILPGGAPFEPGRPGTVEAVSEDGSRVLFLVEEATNQLYLREGGVRTLHVNASQGPGTGGGGRFDAASGDGSKIFFTDDAAAGLTADTVPGSGSNLYEYEAPGGTLRDLTPDGLVGALNVIGVSKDGSYVYLVARGALAGAAIAGQPNLYLLHEGATRYIATLSEADSTDWINSIPETARFSEAPVRVTPDGLHLAFDSAVSLTGYDNRDAATGVADAEVFLYDAAGGQLV